MTERVPSHPDLPAEQAYIDHAYACLDRMRKRVERTKDVGEGEFAAAVLEAWEAKTLESYAEAERNICFGRIDVESAELPLYIGRRWVHGEEHDVVVVNWQAPAARPFYTATPLEPQRVARRRRFRLEGRDLVGIDDEALGGSYLDEPGPLGDYLLEELQRSRTERMREIVATIQADQYRLITRELEGVLVVQGGPGTGKTAVGLHRASWLLYTYRQQLGRRGVLVVGPNRTFIEYVSHVLPSLGETSVRQRAIGDLREGTAAPHRDAGQVERLKGDERMAEVLRRSVELRLRPAEQGLALFLDGTEVRVRPDRVAELREEARRESASYSAGRARLRTMLVRAFYENYGRKLGSDALRAFDEIERVLVKEGRVNRVLDAVWPPLTAERVLAALLTGAELLAEAAETSLGVDEQRLLLRPRGKARAWSESDVPLLDELDELIEGRAESFGHVIVDEAQDLTPMQLRMVARRATAGSLTLLGDIAQATGPVAYQRWQEVLAHLPSHDGVAVEELVAGYRVPAEIMETALPLLPVIAPHARPPESYRQGGGTPRFLRSDEPARTATAEAFVLDAGEGAVAIVAPQALLSELHDLLARAAIDSDESTVEELAPAVRLLGAREAKGLEFDHVVVVEPGAIAAEAAGVQGLRHLYVALTRATKSLTVVHAQDLPAPLVIP